MPSDRSLTERDAGAIRICSDISALVTAQIPNGELAAVFRQEWGRTHASRDAGIGLGAGKLQRDALHTRGQGNETPYSNRNFRWHPLVLAANTPGWVKGEVDSVSLNSADVVEVVVAGVPYAAEDAYTIDGPYNAPPRLWSDEAWSNVKWKNSPNKCFIPAAEYSSVDAAVAVYAALAVAVACGGVFSAPSDTRDLVLEVLSGSSVADAEIDQIPPIDDLVVCPLCRFSLGDGPVGRNKEALRAPVWQRPWKPSKRKEGDEWALQLTHMDPLTEAEVRHTPALTRYGHRWCNVAMTDHSIDETVEFAEQVAKAHR